jgi:thioredoxin 1
MADTNSVKEIDDSSFEQTVSEGVTVVDFWAEWCMPCRMQAPIMEEVSGKLGDRATIGKLNVDENPDTAMKYGITGIPTSIIFKDGAEVKRLVGVQNEGSLMKAIESHL